MVILLRPSLFEYVALSVGLSSLNPLRRSLLSLQLIGLASLFSLPLKFCMASISRALHCPAKCCSGKESGGSGSISNKKSSVAVNGSGSLHGLKAAATEVAYPLSVVTDKDAAIARQNIPREKQLVDPFRQGVIIDGGVRYRQTVVIRSYEIGPDKTATLETILNLLQVNTETLRAVPLVFRYVLD